MVLEGSSDVVTEFPLVDEVLDLILEFVVVIDVVPYVTVVATVLILVLFCSILLYKEGPSKVYSSFTSLKYLSSISIQLGVVSVPTQ